MDEPLQSAHSQTCFEQHNLKQKQIAWLGVHGNAYAALGDLPDIAGTNLLWWKHPRFYETPTVMSKGNSEVRPNT